MCAHSPSGIESQHQNQVILGQAGAARECPDWDTGGALSKEERTISDKSGASTTEGGKDSPKLEQDD